MVRVLPIEVLLAQAVVRQLERLGPIALEPERVEPGGEVADVPVGLAQVRDADGVGRGPPTG